MQWYVWLSYSEGTEHYFYAVALSGEKKGA